MDIGKLSHRSLLLLTLCLAGDAAVRKINSSFNTSTIQSSQKQIQPLQYRIVTGEKYVYVERPTIEEIIERGYYLKSATASSVNDARIILFGDIHKGMNPISLETAAATVGIDDIVLLEMDPQQMPIFEYDTLSAS